MTLEYIHKVFYDVTGLDIKKRSQTFEYAYLRSIFTDIATKLYCTHEQIADFLGLERSSVTNSLSKYQNYIMNPKVIITAGKIYEIINYPKIYSNYLHKPSLLNFYSESDMNIRVKIKNAYKRIMNVLEIDLNLRQNFRKRYDVIILLIIQTGLTANAIVNILDTKHLNYGRYRKNEMIEIYKKKLKKDEDLQFLNNIIIEELTNGKGLL